MSYVKKRLDEEGTDTMRINLAMREKKLSAEPVCDFCGDPVPVFVYASTKMATGEIEQCWRWCACQVCSDAVDIDDWPVVEARLLHRLTGMLPTIVKGSPLILSAVRMALEEFHRFSIHELNLSNGK